MEDDEELLTRILTELHSIPAPHGRERPAAVRLHAWCREHWPQVRWEVVPYGDSGANLLGTAGAVPESVLLYSHLDTSLDGSAADAPVTGRTDPPGPLRITHEADGFGLGVARGPAAAALLGFVRAAAGNGPGSTLLLAGSGTHRLVPGEITGVEHHLATRPRPRQVVVAKAGPPGVLHSEPGAAYLTVRVTGRHGAVLARRHHRPDGGVVAHAGRVVAAVEQWRTGHLAARRGAGQLGAEAGIGYLSAGLATKPDLFPAVLELRLYLVTLPGDRPEQVAAELGKAVAAAVPEGCTATVEAHEIHPAGVTGEHAPVVRRARQVREKYLGAAQDITGWTGSTDGVVFRGHGIDTVRLGPTIGPGPDDPRRDRTPLAGLGTWARIYGELLT
ncbi:hypothetical protein KIH74_26070 [Kineosporia sp. J2-2]|uniref:Acetylornithine deacetylase n=1 Tax=Kineosporia corallincola TaxID=2835133 RepID=A0ABS5TQ10_9ACTN|nr:hypothetical protein [Kineosporia corallincola]MBT0772439.1 hypothetical protein [Kineosporia corallincola]